MVQDNLQKVLLSPLFLFGLSVLLINDFYLKQQFGNFWTGKLSDLAGLFVFPFFIATFFPKRKLLIYLLVALFFLFWKSPFSQSTIELWNSFKIIIIGRKNDYSDLLALLVLPLSYFHFTNQIQGRDLISSGFVRQFSTVSVAVISVFAFTATSLESDRNVTLEGEYTTSLSKVQIEEVLRRNKKIQNLKVVSERDFYPKNTDADIDPNGYYVDFDLNERSCDSTFTRFSFHIQEHEGFTKVKALNASFTCEEKDMSPDVNRALATYQKTLSSIFENEVIKKLRGGDTQ